MNLLTKQKQTHRHRKQTYGYQRGKEVEGINQESGISRHKLLYIKQINNKVLLYSTGNYIQYLIITYNGKESAKLCIYICTYLNHFALHQKLTQCCKLTILQQQQQKKRDRETMGDKTNSEYIMSHTYSTCQLHMQMVLGTQQVFNKYLFTE